MIGNVVWMEVLEYLGGEHEIETPAGKREFDRPGLYKLEVRRKSGLDRLERRSSHIYGSKKLVWKLDCHASEEIAAPCANLQYSVSGRD
jgi:hypothetical protein